ncbi:Uncharacterised protein [Chromobacterium violaceum]|uniref:Uncharacterized protein n=1 Tax=Chromobacterium violaceum TaxID=536 RepID=A0A447T9V7_CHRVL|nr:Uncharacterised protein [Chromobacterium violaceum]
MADVGIGGGRVAWVTRVVVTTPVARLPALASSSSVDTGLPLPAPQPEVRSAVGALATVSVDMEMTSLFILTPVM